MDNGEGSASASHEAESTDTHKQVWNEAATGKVNFQLGSVIEVLNEF